MLHTGHLDDSEITDLGGTRTTTLARTLVDLARSAPFAVAVIAADAALHRNAEIIPQVTEILDRSRYLRGAAAARRALLFADGRAESVGETRLRMVSRQFALPRLELQCNVFDAGGDFVARTDLGYLEAGAMVEFDGKIKSTKLLAPGQSVVDAVLLERDREIALRDLGWEVVRVNWAELANSLALAGRLRDALRRGTRVVAVQGVSGTVRPLPPLRLPR